MLCRHLPPAEETPAQEAHQETSSNSTCLPFRFGNLEGYKKQQLRNGRLNAFSLRSSSAASLPVNQKTPCLSAELSELQLWALPCLSAELSELHLWTLFPFQGVRVKTLQEASEHFFTHFSLPNLSGIQPTHTAH